MSRKNFKKPTRRLFVFLHATFSSLWIGGALSMLILIFLKQPTNGDQLLAYNTAVKLIDDFVIIGSANGVLLTGIILSWKTPWGFFKHWWLAIKLVLTIAMAVFGTLALGPWTNESVSLVQEMGMEAINNSQYQHMQLMQMIFGSLQLSMMLFLLYLTVYKPFKKI